MTLIIAGPEHFMPFKPIHHVVTRPGNQLGDPDIEILVAEDLVTQPGSPVREGDISVYSREYPLEAHFVENSADREWLWSQYTESFSQWRIDHEKRDTPLVEAAAVSGNIPPHVEPDPDVDPTEPIRRKARELGFSEVGFTKYDRRYTYASKKKWVKFQHGICLAYEQEYHGTQKIPSEEAEHTHFGTYTTEGRLSLEPGRLHPHPGLPRAGAQSQRLQRAVHPDVHQRSPGGSSAPTASS